MASERNTVHEADERAALSSTAASREAGRAINDSPIAQIRTKTSNLPEEQRDKLLFELFDMLLARNKQFAELSPAAVVLAKKKGKVKEKLATVPRKRTTQSKPWPSTRQCVADHRASQA
jgi:hypothetical protein